MGIREEIEAEIKAEQQRVLNKKMEARKQERYENADESNRKFGCGLALFVAFVILVAIMFSGSGGDSYDSNDWDFDGDVDVDDATKKLDWIIENE